MDVSRGGQRQSRRAAAGQGPAAGGDGGAVPTQGGDGGAVVATRGSAGATVAADPVGAAADAAPTAVVRGSRGIWITPVAAASAGVGVKQHPHIL
jgi:hypothetical protein